MMDTFYKVIFTIQTISIWLLLRKHGYFEGLSLRPSSIKAKIRENNQGNE
jgi:hypothetical protein